MSEIATTANQPLTLRQQVQRMEHEFALAAPKGVEAQQIVRDVLTAISQNPDLLKCDPQSVLGGAMTMAQLGLRVGVLGHGWLLPFWDYRSKGFKAQLIIGYQGLAELGYRSQQIDKITARTVHEHDHFSVEYGLNEHLTHRPASGDRGKPVGYYATVRIKGSPDPMFYYMTQEEMEVYRDRYAMAKKKDGTVVGPWKSEFEGMAKKTCFRQLSKFMPKGTDLAAALAADESVRLDIDPSHRPEYVSVQPDRDAPPETVTITQDGQRVDAPDVEADDDPDPGAEWGEGGEQA